MAFETTYQGAVPPWECDIVDHFTVGYYYDKLEQATAAMLLRAGIDPTEPAGPRMLSCLTRFSAELRKGDVYRIESAALNPTRLGHRLVNAATGSPCTHFEQTLSAPIPTLPAADTWDGPEQTPEPAPPDNAKWFVTGRDIVTQRDLDVAGRLSAAAVIFRFTTGGENLRALFGMTPAYVREANVGFSTFGFDATFQDVAALGQALTTESCLMHVGKSSLRVVHRLVRNADGARLAQLSQAGVQLDLAARRPRKLPDEMLVAARAMLPG